MSDCIFCKIRDGEIPGDIIHDDEDTLAFNDVNPQAPVHFLIIPKKHIATTNDMTTDDEAIMGKLFSVAKELAMKLDIEDGYRMVVNCNEKAGQTVFHIHMHVLGNRVLRWPPG